MNDHLTKSASDPDADNYADAHPMPILFFAVVPDTFLDGVEDALPSLPAGASQVEEDDASPMAARDRWSF